MLIMCHLLYCACDTNHVPYAVCCRTSATAHAVNVLCAMIYGICYMYVYISFMPGKQLYVVCCK